MPSLAGVFLPSPSPSYLFSKPLNRLDFDPSYPKNPITLRDYIRKYRMEKGLLIRELAEQLRVTEDTVINWEVRGVRPCGKHLEKIMDYIAGFKDSLKEDEVRGKDGAEARQ